MAVLGFYTGFPKEIIHFHCPNGVGEMVSKNTSWVLQDTSRNLLNTKTASLWRLWEGWTCTIHPKLCSIWPCWAFTQDFQRKKLISMVQMELGRWFQKTLLECFRILVGTCRTRKHSYFGHFEARNCIFHQQLGFYKGFPKELVFEFLSLSLLSKKGVWSVKNFFDVSHMRESESSPTDFFLLIFQIDCLNVRSCKVFLAKSICAKKVMCKKSILPEKKVAKLFLFLKVKNDVVFQSQIRLLVKTKLWRRFSFSTNGKSLFSNFFLKTKPRPPPTPGAAWFSKRNLKKTFFHL